MKHYYRDTAKKQILVSDTLIESIDLIYLGQSDWPNIKAKAAMLNRSQVGYTIVSVTPDQA